MKVLINLALLLGSAMSGVLNPALFDSILKPRQLTQGVEFLNFFKEEVNQAHSQANSSLILSTVSDSNESNPNLTLSIKHQDSTVDLCTIQGKIMMTEEKAIVIVDLNSPIENMNVSFQDIDIQKPEEREVLQSRYLRKFFRQCKEIINEPKILKQEIKSNVESYKIDNYTLSL